MNASPVRIAIVMDSTSFGGYEINFYNLAKWLSEAGQAVFCFFPEGSRLYESASGAGLFVIHYTKRNRFDLAAGNRLATKLAELEIGHLYLGRSSDVWLAKWCKRKIAGLKTYFNQETEYGLSKKDLWHRFLYSSLDWWIVPSKFLYDNALERVGIDPEKVIEITSGIDVDRFAAPHLTREQCRDLLGLPQQVFIVGLIGRIDPGKGQHHLVRALAILAEQGLHPHAAIVGYDPRNTYDEYYKEITAIAESAGVSGQIHFVPFQKEVQVAYRALDAFVMASKCEAYGFVTLEAMAAGTIVLGTNAGGTRDLISNGEDGLLWEPESPQALADKLAVILKDEGRASGLGLAAAEKMQRQYSHHDQIKELFHLFKTGEPAQ